MSKYSLQTECLENIEAFSDEQMNREMAVIESVLDIFDKTILMMELSNSDIDVPDCSLFMESTFFQEDDAAPVSNDSTQQTEPQPENNAPAENAGGTNTNQKSSGKGEKVTDDPKAYNKDHHFRKANKEGKLENIFISILLFIPRLIALPIKLLINFIKKKKANKSTSNAKTATPEEQQKVDEAIKKDEGSVNGNTKIQDGTITASATVKGANGDEQVWMNVDGSSDVSINIDMDATSNAVDEAYNMLTQSLEKPNVLNSTAPLAFDITALQQKAESANKQHAEKRVREKLEAFEGRRAQTLTALSKRLNELERCRSTIENTIKQLQAPNALNGFDLSQVVTARKTDLGKIKGIIQWTTNRVKELEAIDALTDEVFAVYDNYLQTVRQAAKTAENAANNDSAALAQDKKDLAAGKAPSQGFNINPALQGGANNNG